MMAMFPVVLFLFAFLFSSVAAAQTPPPGAPFDPSKHPNPIVTFVEEKDFKPVAYYRAKADAGIELLGLSQNEGKRGSVELAEGRFVKNMSILNFRTDVTFYPVVRQKFKLANGSDLVLYSFRFPKVALPREYATFGNRKEYKTRSEPYSFRFPKVALPREHARMILNEAAVEKKKKPNEMRF